LQELRGVEDYIEAAALELIAELVGEMGMH